MRLTADLVEVEQHRRAVDGVRVRVEQLARVVVAVAVREMTARVVVEAEEPLAVRRLADARPVRPRHLRGVLDSELLEHLRLDARGEDREVREEVRIGTGVRLHVRVLRAEELTREPCGLALDVVDVLASRVEAVRGEALRVLVGEERALRELRREGAIVLARDELEVGALVAEFVHHGRRDARSDGRDVIEHRVHRGGRCVGRPAAEAFEVLLQAAHLTPLRTPCVASAVVIGRGSMASICLRRRSWRPPRTLASRNASTIAFASSSPSTRSPKVRKFTSTCETPSRADHSFSATVARTPGTLFAAIAGPIPEPQQKIARSNSPRTSASASTRAMSG